MGSDTGAAETNESRGRGRASASDAAAGLAKGFHLLRASTIASTRLQLALARRDRSQTLAALDGLGEIDAELERVATGLAAESGSDDDLASIREWLAAQKAALASEKFSLVCEVAGAGLVSPRDRLAAPAEGDAGRGAEPEVAQEAAAPPIEDVQQASARPRWLIALLLLSMAMIVAAIPLGVLDADALERLVGRSS